MAEEWVLTELIGAFALFCSRWRVSAFVRALWYELAI